MTAATVAQPNGNGFAVLLVMFLLVSFITVVCLWRTVSRQGREVAALKLRAGRQDSRLKKLADHFKVVIYDDRDDSPQAMAEAPDDDTDEFPAVPATEPSGIPVQVHGALIEARTHELMTPETAERQRVARAAFVEEQLARFDFTGRRK